MRYWFSILALMFCTSPALVVAQSTIQPQRARELGIDVGVLPAGRWNAITDVDGVRVGHQTLVEGESVRTGVTVIVPNTAVGPSGAPSGARRVSGARLSRGKSVRTKS